MTRVVILAQGSKLAGIKSNKLASGSMIYPIVIVV